MNILDSSRVNNEIWEAYIQSGDSIVRESSGNLIDKQIEKEIIDAISNASENLWEYGVSGEPDYKEALRVLRTTRNTREAAEWALAGHTTQNGGEFDDIGLHIDDLADHLDYIINGKERI